MPQKRNEQEREENKINLRPFSLNSFSRNRSKKRNHQHCIDRSYGSIHTNFTVFARHSFKI